MKNKTEQTHENKTTGGLTFGLAALLLALAGTLFLSGCETNDNSSNSGGTTQPSQQHHH